MKKDPPQKPPKPTYRSGLSPEQVTMIRRGHEAFRVALTARISTSGLTKGEVSKAIGMAPATVSQWTGAHAGRLPNVESLFLLAHELGCEPVALLAPVSLAVLRGQPEPKPGLLPADKPTPDGKPAGKVDTMIERLVEARIAAAIERALADLA